MAEKADPRRTERRARALLTGKEIPPAKMEIVRSLMSNDKLLPDEKYNAIIDLLQNCPDKKVPVTRSPAKIETVRRVKKPVTTKPSRPVSLPDIGPTHSSMFVDDLMLQYREHRLFAKKYLILRPGRWKIGIKKRLVPTRRLYRLLKDVRVQQDRLQNRLPAILEAIINDPDIQSPLQFNYLRVLQKWLMETPLISMPLSETRWFDEYTFETEFRNYVRYYFSFLQLDGETRESIILQVEGKLRELPDLKKEPVVEGDTDSIINEKEKRNLKKEKQVYEYILVLRSFLADTVNTGDAINQLLKVYYNLPSFADTLQMIVEALVYRRSMSREELLGAYGAKAPEVRKDTWDYSLDYLKKIGKDPESRRRRQVSVLRDELEPLEQMVGLIGLKFEGQDILRAAFDEQWKSLRRRRQETEDVYDNDFFTFADECLHYFQQAYVPLLNGTPLPLLDRSKKRYETAFFSQRYFERELSLVADIMSDIHAFRTNNPNMEISREETRKIMNGRIKTMGQIEMIYTRMGTLFYNLAIELQRLYRLHMQWENQADRGVLPRTARLPLENRGTTDEEYENGRPFPFFDCVFATPEMNVVPMMRSFIGKSVMNDSIRDGIVKKMMAFCFQMAYEVLSEELFKDIDYQKSLKGQIRELTL